MDYSPEVSVIMSVYNEPIQLLDKSINSILEQSFSNFEFIIINDNPEKIEIKQYLIEKKNSDSRIIIIENDKNIGLAESLNKGLLMARGRFIARMDADDISHKDRLLIQYNYLNESKEVALIGSNIIYIDEKGNELGNGKLPVFHTNHIKRYLKYGNCLNHPTWMFRKDILKEIKGYRNLPAAQDYDFVTRLITSGYKVENIDKALLFYRIRNQSISKSKLFLQKKIGLYIQKMYKQRLIIGRDEYLESTLKNIIEDNSIEVFSEKLLMECNHKNYKICKVTIYLFVFVISKTHRAFLINEISRIILRIRM